jgi:hypothetical protein
MEGEIIGDKKRWTELSTDNRACCELEICNLSDLYTVSFIFFFPFHISWVQILFHGELGCYCRVLSPFQLYRTC